MAPSSPSWKERLLQPLRERFQRVQSRPATENAIAGGAPEPSQWRNDEREFAQLVRVERNGGGEWVALFVSEPGIIREDGSRIGFFKRNFAELEERKDNLMAFDIEPSQTTNAMAEIAAKNNHDFRDARRGETPKVMLFPGPQRD